MKTEFEFQGIEQRGAYLFVNLHLRIGSDTSKIGFLNFGMQVPIANRDLSLAALREESLALARQAIQTKALVQWMAAQEAPAT